MRCNGHAGLQQHGTPRHAPSLSSLSGVFRASRGNGPSLQLHRLEHDAVLQHSLGGVEFFVHLHRLRHGLRDDRAICVNTRELDCTVKQEVVSDGEVHADLVARYGGLHSLLCVASRRVDADRAPSKSIRRKGGVHLDGVIDRAGREVWH